MPDETIVLPKYPVYIPTRGRWHQPRAMTVRFLMRDRVPFHVVCVPGEREQYTELVGDDRVLVLPDDEHDLMLARNWIKQHATDAGHRRHWQLDDNMKGCYRWHRGKRLPCRAGIALRVCEDFTDRYTNVAVAGLNYTTFARTSGPPFNTNVHVYSCSLVNNEMPHRWRLKYNDDTDLCLQVLADGWCTILLNAFLIEKVHTMTVAGGNTNTLYEGDGRLRMARSLERMWPGVVTTRRRFQRPQHVITGAWRKFDTPLIRDPDVAVGDTPNEYGMELRARGDVKSKRLRAMVVDG